MKTQDETQKDIKHYYVNKYVDWVFDRIPHGWRIYDTYKNIIINFKSAYQVLRYGVSDRECWQLSQTFTSFILPRLKHYKKMKRLGFPSELTEQQWETILDEIIFAFEYMHEPEIHNPIPKHWSYETETLANYLAREKTPEEKQANKDYIAKANELDERMKKGLDLFAKHFNEFWD